MRPAIERDADSQQMIPKLTCLLLKTGQAEFSELVSCARRVQVQLCWSFSVAKS